MQTRKQLIDEINNAGDNHETLVVSLFSDSNFEMVSYGKKNMNHVTRISIVRGKGGEFRVEQGDAFYALPDLFYPTTAKVDLESEDTETRREFVCKRDELPTILKAIRDQGFMCNDVDFSG